MKRRGCSGGLKGNRLIVLPLGQVGCGIHWLHRIPLTFNPPYKEEMGNGCVMDGYYFIDGLQTLSQMRDRGLSGHRLSIHEVL